jgi:hypothetical protein
VSESLKDKYQARVEFDGTIAETEAAYNKILESSQTLLTVLKREQTALVSKTPQVKQLANVQDLDINSPRAGSQQVTTSMPQHPMPNTIANGNNGVHVTGTTHHANGHGSTSKPNEILRTKSKSFFSFTDKAKTPVQSQ